jgi:outer membrane protein W
MRDAWLLTAIRRTAAEMGWVRVSSEKVGTPTLLLRFYFQATFNVAVPCLGCSWQYTRCSDTDLSTFSSGTVMIRSSPALITSLTLIVSMAKPCSAARLLTTFNVKGLES